MNRITTLFAALAIIVCSTFAFADPVSFGSISGCPDSVCLGASYTFNIVSYTGNQLKVDYIIDGRTFTNGTGFGNIIGGKTDGIFALSLNFSIPITAVSLLQAPGGINNWSPQTGGQNSGGCNGQGAPYGCAQVTSLGLMPVVGSMETDPYVWEFLLTTNGAALGSASAKADFYSYSSGRFVNQISLSAPRIPEPRSLMLLGTGLLIVGTLLRRRLVA